MTTTHKLNQVIAIERPIKKRVNEKINAEYKLGQKGEPFTGLSRTYTPKHDDGDQMPPETKNVQAKVSEILNHLHRDMVEIFDITAAKDHANCNARASILVDGQPLISDVPSTFLLFVEKYVTDIRTIVSKLPVLSPDERWTKKDNEDVWRSEAVETLSTRKVHKPVVLHPGTDKHAPQTQLVQDDVVMGTWTTTKLSGAMSAPEKEALLARIEKLLKATKVAREQANMVDAPAVPAGEKILGWLFSRKEG